MHPVIPSSVDSTFFSLPLVWIFVLVKLHCWYRDMSSTGAIKRHPLTRQEILAYSPSGSRLFQKSMAFLMLLCSFLFSWDHTLLKCRVFSNVSSKLCMGAHKSLYATQRKIKQLLLLFLSFLMLLLTVIALKKNMRALHEFVFWLPFFFFYKKFKLYFVNLTWQHLHTECFQERICIWVENFPH